MARAKAGEATMRESIGALMRDIRKRRKMTLEQLSDLTGISVSSLSRIENTRLGMTIEKVEKLARALGVPPETFVSRPGSRRSLPPGPAANRGGSGARFIIDRAGRRKASRYRELSIDYLFDGGAERSMDCMHLAVEAINVWDSEFVRHPGEKIIYMIKGEAVVYCERKEPVILGRGDALYMDGAVWHSVVAVGGGPAELLVTVSAGPDSTGVPFETETFTPESWSALQAD